MTRGADIYPVAVVGERRSNPAIVERRHPNNAVVAARVVARLGIIVAGGEHHDAARRVVVVNGVEHHLLVIVWRCVAPACVNQISESGQPPRHRMDALRLEIGFPHRPELLLET